MSTEFYLIRHGESVANLLHSLAGSTDVPLTELGINQAEATARALRDIHFDAVYSSPLVRAVDTAKPHAEMRGLRVQVHEGVREIFLGEWEGRRVDEIIKSYGISSYEGGWQGSFGTYRVPGAESAAECAERVFAAMKEIALRNPDSRVLVVSHGAAFSVTSRCTAGFFSVGMPRRIIEISLSSSSILSASASQDIVSLGSHILVSAISAILRLELNARCISAIAPSRSDT